MSGVLNSHPWDKYQTQPWTDSMNTIQQKVPAPMPNKLKQLMDELEAEEKQTTDPEPTPVAKASFNIYRTMNGYVVNCNRKNWVCPDDRELLDVIKMALADARI